MLIGWNARVLVSFIVLASSLAGAGEFRTGDAPRVIATAGNSNSAPVGGRALAVDTSNRAAVASFFTTNYTPPPPNGWTGSSVVPYNPGTVSQAYQDATLSRVNFYRALAGQSSTIVFDPALNAKCQQAALMFSVAGQLSHMPPSAPDATWLYATPDGAAAAGHSNISLGSDGPDAMDGLMADPGDNNTVAGHRRWILYPQQVTMGHGGVSGVGKLLAGDALWVIATFGTPPTTAANVPWPPAGYFPYQILPFDYSPTFTKISGRWSFTLANADFSAATVTMASGGQNVNLQAEKVENGYGDNTLVWKALGVPIGKPAADIKYDVTVSNVMVSGAAKTFNYSVIVFDPATAGSSLPIANAQTITTGQDKAANITLSGSNGTIFALGTQPGHGTLTGLNATSGAVTYTPAAGYSGPDSFTFTISDGKNTSAPATVSITVTGAGGPGPQADAQTLTTVENTPLPVVLTGTNGALFAIGTGPAHGALGTLNTATGSVTYTPASGYVGSDSFTFTVGDGKTVSAAATISITVTASGGGGSNPAYPADLAKYLKDNNIPANATASTTSGPQSKTTLAISLNFKTGVDGLTFVTPVNLGAGTVLSGKQIVIDIGGVIQTYSLDGKAKDSTDPSSKLTLSGKIKNGVTTLAGPVKFTVKLAHADLESTLAGAGLKDDQVYMHSRISLPVTVVVVDAQASTVMSGTLTLDYSAKPGGMGTGKGGL